MMLSNYHTHTTFCDGIDTPEEMVLEAIRLGMSELGFSGHAHMSFDSSYCMSLEGTEQYKAEVNRLKLKYADKIKILLGIEQDIYSDTTTDSYDYVIGSVHHVLKNGEYLAVDLSRAEQERIIADYYGGDQYAFAEDYYRAVATVYEITKCDIIGHFDLCTKYKNRIVLPRDDEYYKAAFEAIEQLIPYKKPFEINFGAIARGYRNSPYPDKVILKEIKRRGGEIIFNSDCHDRTKLGLNYDIAVRHAIDCGFEGRVILTKNGKKQVDF